MNLAVKLLGAAEIWFAVKLACGGRGGFGAGRGATVTLIVTIRL